MTVYGYVRVSTDRQVDEGVSLGAQERALQGYAMQHGLTLERVFVEQGVSGSTPIAERPEGAKLLAELRPGDVVLVKASRGLALDTVAEAILAFGEGSA